MVIKQIVSVTDETGTLLSSIFQAKVSPSDDILLKGETRTVVWKKN